MTVQFDEYEENFRRLGNFTLVRTNPFGFWVIKPDKGRVPKELDCSFTSAQLAGRAVLDYMNKRDKEKAA